MSHPTSVRFPPPAVSAATGRFPGRIEIFLVNGRRLIVSETVGAAAVARIGAPTARRSAVMAV